MSRFFLAAVCCGILLSLSAQAAMITPFGSADDLDLNGDFIYAVDVYGPGGSVAGLNFTHDGVAGVTINASSVSKPWGTKPNFLGTDAATLENIMHSIRFGSHNSDVEILLDVVSGQKYQMQLLFSENYWPNAGQRTFDVLIDGSNVVDEFDVAAEQGDVLGGGPYPRSNTPFRGAVLTETVVATGSVMTIDLLQGTTAGDDNPFINAFTLKAIPEPNTFSLALLGAIGMFCRCGRRR